MLSEIAIECKEKAILIYKLFKIYFVEIEKKWISLTIKLKDKIHYYKDLCQTILQQKNKSLLKIETISDVLFANKLTKENLEDHKKLIQDLLQLINEKRDEMYLIQAQLDIANQELEYWIYDYQNIKINPKLRERMKECNINKIIQNVNEEMTHKQISKEDKSMLVNADKFLLVSGQRNYFFDQKAYYQSEIDRLTKMYQKHYYKKRNFKKQVIDLKEELGKEKYRLENEIKFLREKLIWEKHDLAVQTDIDINYINKMQKNHEIVIYQKRLSQNKLSHFIEKIKYNFSKQKPFSLKSMLNLIPEIYNEKIEDDNKCDLEGRRKLLMDDFFYQYITKKFKLSKIIKKNCEQTIMTIFKYCSEDNRVDLFRKFLGIGDDRIRREILDNYLIILKNLPVSFFKLFEDDYKSYLMNTEMCFEILFQKFPNYEMVFINKDQIISSSLVSSSNNDKEEELLSKEFNPETKLNMFLLNRLYNRSLIFINSINTELISNHDAEVQYDKFYENFTLVNKEFEFLNDIHIFDIFQKNFELYKNTEKNDYFIKSESFLNYFLKKSFFKIRIVDFLEISFNSLISIYGGLEKKIYKLYDDADFRKNGYILYKEFEDILLNLIGNTENKWKINELFKIAVGSQEKEFLSREEFIIFCLNNRELLNILLKVKKNNI
jgi:hypothetical protein